MAERDGRGKAMRRRVLPAWVAVLLLAAGPARAGRIVLPRGEPSPASARVVPAASKGELHLPRGRHVPMPWSLADGGGFTWGVEFNASLIDGLRALAGYELDVNGVILDPPKAAGSLSADGREIGLGPWRVGGLDLYRRVRVYKDGPVCRWLDVYTNPSGSPITVRLRSWTAIRHGIGRTLTSQGGELPGAKNCAMIVVHAGPAEAAPHVLLVTSDGGGRLATKVDVEGKIVNARWTLTVRAGATAVLCHFKALGAEADLKRLLARWQTAALLRDLPLSARKLIVNLDATGTGRTYLERSEQADSVLLADGRRILGTIENKSYQLTATPMGKVALPAADVVGMAAGKGGRVLLVLTDGQAVSAAAGDVKVRLALAEGAKLAIPCEKIKQWSYRISAARPAARPLAGPHVRLRGGDRLAVAAGELAPTFRTPHGVVRLDRRHVLEVTARRDGRAGHRAVFANGSRLAGELVDKDFTVTVKLAAAKGESGHRLTFPPSRLAHLHLAEQQVPDVTLTHVGLAGGDELFGTLTDTELKLITEFGKLGGGVSLIKAIRRKPGDPNSGSVEMWNGSVLKCRLETGKIGFEINPAARLKIDVGRIVSITRAQPAPPRVALARIHRLLGQLGGESYKDREAATKALIDIGPRIVPLLRRYLHAPDAEVRQRVEGILEKLTPKPPPPPPPAGDRRKLREAARL